MELLTKIVGTIGLYAILWAGLFLGVFLIKEKFFKKTDDWVTGIILGLITSTVGTVGLFIFNHVSFRF